MLHLAILIREVVMMSFRPMDLQTMIPKVSEVSRIQSAGQQRGLAIQQSAVQSTEKQSESNLKQVISREEAQKTAIRDQQEKQKQQKKQRDKEESTEKDKKKQQDETEQTLSGRTIDIRL